MNFDHDEAALAHRVRLFPSIRISSEKEAELRATAALLSMVCAVSEFGRTFVRAAGGPAGRIDCFTEISFSNEGSQANELRPDGIVRATRGQREWKALVEVKVGDNRLEQKQFDAYHKLARREAFDALVTISNQAALPNGLPPLSIDRRRLRGVPVCHLSWDRLLSEAKLLSKKKAIEDRDQQWMLEEWIRYAADPRSKIIEPPHLGERWHGVLQAATRGQLASVSADLRDVVERWDAFLRKTSLRLRAQLGVDVEVKIPRNEREDPEARLRRLHGVALQTSVLSGEFRIPGAAGDLAIDLLLSGSSLRCSTELKAPTEGRQLTRINWLLRQLEPDSVPKSLVIRVDWEGRRIRSQAQAVDAVSDPSLLLRSPQGQTLAKDLLPRRYCLEQTTKLKRGRGRSTSGVLDGIVSDIEGFYRAVMEGLVPYVPRAPKLAPETALADHKVEPAAQSPGTAGPAQPDLPQQEKPSSADQAAQQVPSPGSVDETTRGDE